MSMEYSISENFVAILSGDVVILRYEVEEQDDSWWELGKFGQSKAVYDELNKYEEYLSTYGYVRVRDSEYGNSTHHGGQFSYKQVS